MSGKVHDAKKKDGAGTGSVVSVLTARPTPAGVRTTSTTDSLTLKEQSSDEGIILTDPPGFV